MKKQFKHKRMETNTPSPGKRKFEGFSENYLGRGSARGMMESTNKERSLTLDIIFGIMFGIPGCIVIGIGHHLKDNTAIYIGYALVGLGFFIGILGICWFCKRKAKEEEIKKIQKLQNEGGSYTYDDEGMTVTLVYPDRRPSRPEDV